MRKEFIATLTELAEKDERIFLITPDLGFSVLEDFEKKFPERFLNIGIAEANAVSVAAGLALSGKIVYVYSITPFVTMRPFEQVRVDVAYMNTNVRLVGLGAGLSYGPAGATHHAIEDISLMRSLPNMTVFTPGNTKEVEEIAKISATQDGPMYIRLGKSSNPYVGNEESNFIFGHVNKIKEDRASELAILYAGNISDRAHEVSQSLDQLGIKHDLTSVYCVKPFDQAYLDEILKEKQYIVTLEEHSRIGGLGSTVAEQIAESKYSPKFKRIGIPDKYSHFVGGQNFIRDKMDLSIENIIYEIKGVINE